jgi:hypothetical protein
MTNKNITKPFDVYDERGLKGDCESGEDDGKNA